jgi:hypothetical protein
MKQGHSGNFFELHGVEGREGRTAGPHGLNLRAFCRAGLLPYW